MEFRFWAAYAAREFYAKMTSNGKRCNMSSDGRGVIVFGCKELFTV
jgi:hypothetical protein